MKLPRIFKNFYLVSGVIFILWIFFLDSNDLLTQYFRRQRMRELEKQKVFYQKRIDEIKTDQKLLQKSPRVLEKFAREKYFFKRSQEEVFVIEEEPIKTEK